MDDAESVEALYYGCQPVKNGFSLVSVGGDVIIHFEAFDELHCNSVFLRHHLEHIWDVNLAF